MEKLKICFDMDGTIANLYKVANWLSKLLFVELKGNGSEKISLSSLMKSIL